jgi:hypothetical protein
MNFRDSYRKYKVTVPLTKVHMVRQIQIKISGNMRNSCDEIPLFKAASSYSAGDGIFFAIQTYPRRQIMFQILTLYFG